MEKKEWVRCDRCDGEIYEGTEYYQINGECVCRECLEEFAGHWFAPFRLIAGEELGREWERAFGRRCAGPMKTERAAIRPWRIDLA